MVAHLSRGYPVRPESVDPIRWQTWCERIEAALDDLRERVMAHCPPDLAVWMNETFVCKIFRQLAIREIRQWHCTGSSPFAHLSVPWRCTHPCASQGLWTCSVWNWLWLMFHLGNQRERFPPFWNHVQSIFFTSHTTGSHPQGEGVDPWRVLLHDPTVVRCLHWMSQGLHDFLEASSPLHPETSNESDTNWPYAPWYDGYVTQPDSPERNDADDASLLGSDTSTQSPPEYIPESESLPSSLDRLLDETFAIPEPYLPDPEWPL